MTVKMCDTAKILRLYRQFQTKCPAFFKKGYILVTILEIRGIFCYFKAMKTFEEWPR